MKTFKIFNNLVRTNILRAKSREGAFEYLVEENCGFEKNKHVVLDNLKMSQYLWENKNKELSLAILIVRSQSQSLQTGNRKVLEGLAC